MPNLFEHCRAGVSSAQPKIRISRAKKQARLHFFRDAVFPVQSAYGVFPQAAYPQFYYPKLQAPQPPKMVFFCKLRLRGAKQATPHQTPPSTPSTIFRKTATVVHSDVKAPSIQKIARKLLWFRFFVLLLGIAICRIGRREFCSCKIWGDFYAPTKHKNARRVVSHAPDSGVQVMSYGRGFLCCWRQGISPEPNSDNARLTFHLFRRVA